MDSKPAQSKTALRRKLRAERRSLSDELQREHARHLAHNTLQTLLTLRFRRFALYLPTDGEISTWPLINKLLSFDLLVALPCLRRNTTGKLQMHFARFTHNTPLVRGPYELLEPEYNTAQHANIGHSFIPDVLFTPLVGFDTGGQRLGMGGGFYDQYTNPLERAKPALRIGLAHEQQGLPVKQQLTHESWDKPLDGVITEQGIKGFSARGALCLNCLT